MGNALFLDIQDGRMGPWNPLDPLDPRNAPWSCPYETGHAAGDELAWMNSRGESILSPLCGWLLL